MPSKRSRRHAARRRIREVAERVARKLDGWDFQPEFMSVDVVISREEISVDEAKKRYPVKGR